VIKVCVAGCGGRMGKAIIEYIKTGGEAVIAGLLESASSSLLGTRVEGVEITSEIEKAVKKSDIIIDFTTPAATLSHIAAIAMPAVIGTTGFSDEDKKKIQKYSVKNPVVFSPNMSRGVNVLFCLVKKATSGLPEYDIEIVEAHHNKKKDSPSGTAKRITSVINEIRQLSPVYGRVGNVGARKKDELGIHAVRAGDIVGEHNVIFAGAGECLEISHRAYSRDCFAAGAVEAAKWLVGKPAGLYGMNDVLGID